MLRPLPPLTLAGVFSTLHQIAATGGAGSGARRQALVLGLLRGCRDVETRYLVRTLIRNLRIGADWRSVLGPLARAVLVHRKVRGVR
jgi:DNA ligase-1